MFWIGFIVGVSFGLIIGIKIADRRNRMELAKTATLSRNGKTPVRIVVR